MPRAKIASTGRWRVSACTMRDTFAKCREPDPAVLRHHHVLHSPGWAAKLLPDGTFVVTTPGGRTLEGQPPGRPPPRPLRE